MVGEQLILGPVPEDGGVRGQVGQSEFNDAVQQQRPLVSNQLAQRQWLHLLDDTMSMVTEGLWMSLNRWARLENPPALAQWANGVAKLEIRKLIDAEQRRGRIEIDSIHELDPERTPDPASMLVQDETQDALRTITRPLYQLLEETPHGIQMRKALQDNTTHARRGMRYRVKMQQLLLAILEGEELSEEQKLELNRLARQASIFKDHRTKEAS